MNSGIHRCRGKGMCPLLKFSVRGMSPLRFLGGRKIGEKIEKRKGKSKLANLSIASKQIGKLMSFLRGVTPLRPNFFIPVPLKMFELLPPLVGYKSLLYVCMLNNIQTNHKLFLKKRVKTLLG